MTILYCILSFIAGMYFSLWMLVYACFVISEKHGESMTNFSRFKTSLLFFYAFIASPQVVRRIIKENIKND